MLHAGTIDSHRLATYPARVPAPSPSPQSARFPPGQSDPVTVIPLAEPGYSDSRISIFENSKQYKTRYVPSHSAEEGWMLHEKGRFFGRSSRFEQSFTLRQEGNSERSWSAGLRTCMRSLPIQICRAKDARTESRAPVSSPGEKLTVAARALGILRSSGSTR